MNVPGKSMLKVTSILFIAFGITATLVNLVTLARNLMVPEYTVVGLELTLELIYFFVLIISNLLGLVLGVLGIKKCADPSQANFFVVTGIIFCVLNLVPMVGSFMIGRFNLFRLIGFVLPVLYIIGGILNKKAAAAPAA